jgi:very-short-patch-repair endonuclease
MNVWIGDQEVDAVWEEQKMAVPIDSWKYHSTHSAFEGDRRRLNALQLLGYRLLVVTDRRLVDAPEAVLADLRKLLS